MNRLISYIISLVVLICFSSLCLAADLRNFMTPVSRQAAVRALLAGEETKSVFTDAVSKHGIPAAQVSMVATTQLPRLTSQTQLRTAPSAAPSGDTELRNLNWAGGFTFTSFVVPRYGSGNWRLGVLNVKHARISTWLGDTVTLEDLHTKQVAGVINLVIELPENDPALYAIIFKLVGEQDGKCSQSWLRRSGSTRDAITVRFFNLQSGQYVFSPPAMPLALLQDLTGFVGVIGVNPSESAFGNEYGMRRQTSQIRLDVNDLGLGVLNQNLLFGGITIMRF